MAHPEFEERHKRFFAGLHRDTAWVEVWRVLSQATTLDAEASKRVDEYYRARTLMLLSADLSVNSDAWKGKDSFVEHLRIVCGMNRRKFTRGYRQKWVGYRDLIIDRFSDRSLSALSHYLGYG